jgi:glycerol-3-phosphate dehydrogenase
VSLLSTPHGPRSFLTAERRRRQLEELEAAQPVDVLVVGGGVTGAGVALDAATRGLRTVLLERRDLAHGTSRWSSKLAHGGLRYLAGLHFGIAWESAREREILADVSAPHLIRALPQLTPVYGRVPPAGALALETGIRMGDAMRAMAGTSRRRLPAARRVSAAEAKLWTPAVCAAGLRGGILAWDGQLEDDARLVVALARSAAAHGAAICTYCEVQKLHGDGARVLDVRSGETLQVRARHIVNATGVWAGQLVSNLSLRPSRGSHLLLRAAALGHPRAALNVPVPGHFGRFVFALPRPDGPVLVGLTDVPHEQAQIPEEPAVSAEEERFLLETLSEAIERPLRSEDVLGRYAGLRPLLDDGHTRSAEISRRHAVLEDPASGAITVVGGKLTTYRRMAEDALDTVLARAGSQLAPCVTARLALLGAPPRGVHAPVGLPLRLWRRFGTEAPEIAALAEGRAELLEPVAPGLPVLGVELLAAVQREGAITAEDVLDRRTRLGLVPAWREAASPAVESLLGDLAAV